MLVFTRKLGERVIIGDNIQVAILQIRGNQIRVGVAAPMDISVRRVEFSGLSTSSFHRLHLHYRPVRCRHFARSDWADRQFKQPR